MSITYNDNDKGVALYALNAIIYLCRYDGDNRDTHSNSNVSKLEPVCSQVPIIITTNTTSTHTTSTKIIRILNIHGTTSSDVALYGIKAIGFLASDPANIGTTNTTTTSTTTTNTTTTITTNNNTIVSLGNTNACDCIISIISTHITDVDICW